jgi:cytoskeletal protein RodZ
MTTENKSISFGSYLKTIRIEKGIDLEDVSRKTKIRVDNLILIEKEDHARLPDEVYVKGFLRAFAKAIGADGDETVRRYLRSLQIFQEATGGDTGFNKNGKAFWLRILLSLVAMACIIAVTVFMIPFFQEPHPIDNQSDQPVVNENNHDVAVKDPQGTESKADVVDEHYESISEKLLLRIITIEDTWIKIIIDGQNRKEYSLHPGDRLELEASKGFNVLIGNATGIQLTLNGNPLNVPGKSGQVVALQIP